MKSMALALVDLMALDNLYLLLCVNDLGSDVAILCGGHGISVDAIGPKRIRDGTA